jgi:hypothetical protein
VLPKRRWRARSATGQGRQEAFIAGGLGATRTRPALWRAGVNRKSGAMKNSAYRLDEDPGDQRSSLAEITHAASAERQGSSSGTDGTAGRANTELIEQMGDRSFQDAVSFLLRAQWEREAKPADCPEDATVRVEGGLPLTASQAQVRFALKLVILAELVIAAIFLGRVLSGGA